MNMKIQSIVFAAMMAAVTGYSTTFLTVDFESDTVGQNPSADYVSPGTPTADNFVTVVGSTTNTAGTGNGVRLYDNGTGTGSRVGYDFSTGESAVRFDISLAQRLDTGNASRYYSICILANGASPTSSGNRYTEVRVYDNGDIKYYDNGGTGGTLSDYMTVGTAATLTMYANDSDTAISNYQPGQDLAANSVDFWLDGTYWGTGALLASLSGGTTAGLGRVAVASGSGDIAMDYVFDDIEVSTVTESAVLVSDDYETDTIGAKPANADDVSPSTPASDLAVVVVGGTTNLAGTGNAVRLLDDSTGGGARLGYDMVAAASNQLSAARADFSFAALSTTNSDDYIIASFGEYGVAQSSSIYRFLDCRLYADGTIDFRSTLGQSSYNNALLASNNTLSVFVNDLDDQSIYYVGPDSNTYLLETNSVAYWLNGSLIDFSGAGCTLMENRTTANGTIFSSTNNIGRFGFSSASGDYGLDYVIDNLELQTLDLDVQPPVFPDYLFYESFDDQTVGAQPTGVAYLRPTSNTSSNLVEVVNSSVNTTGPGNGVRYLDDDSVNSGAMVWNFVADSGSQISAVRVDLNLAPLSTSDSSNDLRIAVGTYGNTLASHGSRYINCRAYSTGKIGFDPNIGGADTGITNAVDLSSSSNALTLIVNDYDAETVTYTGLDDATYVLPANSVAYWLNGTLQTFDGAEYTSMDVGDTTTGGTVGTTTNNLGSFGLVSASSFTGLDYLFDEILITTNGLTINPAAADHYADWAATNGVTGASGDDDDSDGLSNFGEYVFDGNPEAAGDLGTQPVFSAGNYIFSLRADSSLSYMVLTNSDLVNGVWGTNAGPTAVTADDGAMDAYTNSIGTTAGQLFIRLIVE